MARGKLTGIPEVMALLNREIHKIKGHTLEGLIEGAMVVRVDMDKTPPLIPIDLGNLRASWFTTTSDGREVSQNNESFKGKTKGELSTDHSSAIGAAKAEAKKSKMPMVVMGFSANYAAPVHEKVGANFAGDPSKGKKGKRRAGAGAKFFEASLKRNIIVVLQIITEKARIK